MVIVLNAYYLHDASTCSSRGTDALQLVNPQRA
jgi:hypothetical protein